MTDTVPNTTPEAAIEHESLQQALLAERNEAAMHTVHQYAARYCEGVIPLGGKRIESIFHSDRNPFGLSVGSLDYPTVRIERDLVNRAAQEAGIPVEYGTTLGNEDTDKVMWEGEHDGFLSLRYADSTGLLRTRIAEKRQEESRPFEQLAEEVRAGSNRAVTEEQFALDDSTQDKVFNFMDIPNTWSDKPAKSRAYFLERLYALPVHIEKEEDIADGSQSMEGVYFDTEGNLVKILQEHSNEPGVYCGMYFPEGTRVDPTEAKFNLGIEIQPERAVLERSYNHDIVVEPFLETQTAKEMIEIATRTELAPSPVLNEILKAYPAYGDAYDSRYGNSYSELTREVAKIVGNPARRYTKLFVGDEAEIAQKIAEINVEDIASAPVRTLFQLLKESMNPQRNLFAADIPVHDGMVKIRDKSCKDAEAYFLGSIRDGQTTLHDVQGRKMLHKHSGGRTAINLDPVIYRGVTIPAGGLFQRHDDGKGGEEYAFIRMTSFAFEPDDARDAFTWQYLETQKNTGFTADAPSLAGLIRS